MVTAWTAVMITKLLAAIHIVTLTMMMKKDPIVMHPTVLSQVMATHLAKKMMTTMMKKAFLMMILGAKLLKSVFFLEAYQKLHI